MATASEPLRFSPSGREPFMNVYEDDDGHLFVIRDGRRAHLMAGGEYLRRSSGLAVRDGIIAPALANGRPITVPEGKTAGAGRAGEPDPGAPSGGDAPGPATPPPAAAGSGLAGAQGRASAPGEGDVWVVGHGISVESGLTFVPDGLTVQFYSEHGQGISLAHALSVVDLPDAHEPRAGIENYILGPPKKEEAAELGILYSLHPHNRVHLIGYPPLEGVADLCSSPDACIEWALKNQIVEHSPECIGLFAPQNFVHLIPQANIIVCRGETKSALPPMPPIDKPPHITAAVTEMCRMLDARKPGEVEKIWAKLGRQDREGILTLNTPIQSWYLDREKSTGIAAGGKADEQRFFEAYSALLDTCASVRLNISPAPQPGQATPLTADDRIRLKVLQACEFPDRIYKNFSRGMQSPEKISGRIDKWAGVIVLGECLKEVERALTVLLDVELAPSQAQGLAAELEGCRQLADAIHEFLSGETVGSMSRKEKFIELKLIPAKPPKKRVKKSKRNKSAG
ncbi:putative adhesin [Streptomyces sp. NPDC055085]